jgi:hypothetical protein
MDYLPPGRVVRVGDRRWKRYVIRDCLDRFWAGEGRWSDEPSGALLFCRELDATKQKSQYCLGDAADTFVAKVVMSVHAGRWSAEELVAHLRRHKQFCVGGPAGKGGILLEIVPDTLRKAKGCGDR